MDDYKGSYVNQATMFARLTKLARSPAPAQASSTTDQATLFSHSRAGQLPPPAGDTLGPSKSGRMLEEREREGEKQAKHDDRLHVIIITRSALHARAGSELMKKCHSYKIKINFQHETTSF